MTFFVFEMPHPALLGQSAIGGHCCKWTKAHRMSLKKSLVRQTVEKNMKKVVQMQYTPPDIMNLATHPQDTP